MKVRILNSYKGKHIATFCLFVLIAGMFCVSRQCRADDASALSVDPLQLVTWESGPQRVNLGDYADIDLPAGYRLTDVRGARILLESQNDTPPADLVGVLASQSGKWWAVLEYSPKGYVKDAGQIDSDLVLKNVQDQLKAQNNAGSLASSVNWVSKPAYDSQAHSLAWSLQVQNGATKALNQSVALLGRNGVFQITAVQPYPLTESPSLNDLAKSIIFKDGERYADYQAGDKVAQIGLAELIAGNKPAASTATAGMSGGTVMIAIYSGLAVCIVVGSVMLLRKKNRRHTAKVSAPSAARASAPRQTVVQKAVAQPIMAQTVVAQQPIMAQPAAAAPVEPVQPAIAATAKIAVNGTNGAKQLHRNRRKKVFNYPKFYTTVMRELSLHSYGPGASNGKMNGHANGYANGHKNGHANGHTNGQTTPANGIGVSNANPSVTESLKSEIVELIATQKNLINEQKCLLEQQTKLIEEKRWLIEEQTAFLKGQSEQKFL